MIKANTKLPDPVFIILKEILNTNINFEVIEIESFKKDHEEPSYLDDSEFLFHFNNLVSIYKMPTSKNWFLNDNYQTHLNKIISDKIFNLKLTTFRYNQKYNHYYMKCKIGSIETEVYFIFDERLSKVMSKNTEKAA
jgi:hypothetical protein